MEYRNRYGDIFTFEFNEKGNIDWKGNFQYCRFGFIDNPADLTMIDPSGGPYIALEQDMAQFGLEGKVSGFIDRDDYYELVIER